LSDNHHDAGCSSDPTDWGISFSEPEPFVDSIEDVALEFVHCSTNGNFDNEAKMEIAHLCAAFNARQSSPKGESAADAEYLSAVQRFRLYFLSAMMTMMRASPNPGATFAALAYALGLHNGKSLRQLASEHETSAANLSKQCTAFLRMTGLEGSFGCKSRATVRTYATCARKPKRASVF
jgi:hypothetical protein